MALHTTNEMNSASVSRTRFEMPLRRSSRCSANDQPQPQDATRAIIEAFNAHSIATPCKSRWTSCAAIRSWRRRSCSTWCCSWTWRSAPGCAAFQEWLSFYFKSPMCAPQLYPEHDLFIQLMKLKNTLRWMMGEELITHLGAEYYD